MIPTESTATPTPAMGGGDEPLAPEEEQLLDRFIDEYSRDGLADTFMGGLFLLMGGIISHWGTNWPEVTLWPLAFLVLALVMLFLLLWAWKRFITYPRLGFARLDLPPFYNRKPWQKGLMVLLMNRAELTRRRVRPTWARVLGLLGRMFVLYPALSIFCGILYKRLAIAAADGAPLDLQGRVDTFHWVLMFVLFPLVLFASPRKWRRRLVEPLLILALYLPTELLTQQPVWGYCVTGAGFCLIGLVRLLLFLRDYPVLEAPDAS